MSNRLEEFEKKLYKRGGETEEKQKSYELYKEDDVFAPRPGWLGKTAGVVFLWPAPVLK